MKIAVTGSTGLIGSALVPALAAAGHDVVRIVRSGPAGPGVVRSDPAAGTIDAAALEGIDGVVHLAGEGVADKRWTPEQKARILDSRVKGTTLLATTLAGLDRRPSVLLSGSAVGIYGDRGDEELTEHSAAGSGFLTEVATKWEAAAAAATEAGIRTAFLRTGIVLSPKGGSLKQQVPLFKFGLGGRLGDGQQWVSWISLDDEVGAIVHLLTADAEGPVNLTAPEPTRNADFTKVLGRVLRRPTLLPTPRFGPKLLLGGELAEELLYSSAKVRPTVLEASGYTFRHRALEPALRDLLDRPAAA